MFTPDHIALSDTLTGVVLMGGQSKRMGFDKSSITLDDQFLYQHASNLLKPFCDRIVLSINRHQLLSKTYEYPTVIDKYEAEGPMGGILSCFEVGYSPLLILAVDMVNIKPTDIAKLLPVLYSDDTFCSIYFNIKNQRYEPMLSLWTTVGLQKLKTSFDHGERSFQRFLKSEKVNIYSVEDEISFININTKDELSSWLAKD